MALALNNLKRVDMPLNKETKPNQDLQRMILFTELFSNIKCFGFYTFVKMCEL